MRKSANTQEIGIIVDCEDENKNSKNNYDDVTNIQVVKKVFCQNVNAYNCIDIFKNSLIQSNLP